MFDNIRRHPGSFSDEFYEKNKRFIVQERRVSRTFLGSFETLSNAINHMIFIQGRDIKRDYLCVYDSLDGDFYSYKKIKGNKLFGQVRLLRWYNAESPINGKVLIEKKNVFLHKRFLKYKNDRERKISLDADRDSLVQYFKDVKIIMREYRRALFNKKIKQKVPLWALNFIFKKCG